MTFMFLAIAGGCGVEEATAGDASAGATRFLSAGHFGPGAGRAQSAADTPGDRTDADFEKLVVDSGTALRESRVSHSGVFVPARFSRACIWLRSWTTWRCRHGEPGVSDGGVTEGGNKNENALLTVQRAKVEHRHRHAVRYRMIRDGALNSRPIRPEEEAINCGAGG